MTQRLFHFIPRRLVEIMAEQEKIVNKQENSSDTEQAGPKKKCKSGKVEPKRVMPETAKPKSKTTKTAKGKPNMNKAKNNKSLAGKQKKKSYKHSARSRSNNDSDADTTTDDESSSDSEAEEETDLSEPIWHEEGKCYLIYHRTEIIVNGARIRFREILPKSGKFDKYFKPEDEILQDIVYEIAGAWSRMQRG
jgi:hypothetical protein